MTLTKITEKGIKDGEIIDADINPSAAIAGSKLANLVSSDANNRILTATGTTNSFNGESNLTYDGSKLQVATDAHTEGIRIVSTGDTYNDLVLGANRTSSATHLGRIIGEWNGGQVASIAFNTGADATGKDDGFINFQTSNGGSSMTPRMTIQQDGKIGIGTESPDRLIHGAGATPILKLDSTNNEAYIQLKTASPSNETYIGLVDGDIYMATSGTGATTGERFRIKANGRVGINNASPSGTLSVNDPNGDNVTLILHTGATTNYIQLSDSVNAHTYIAKENSSNLSQVAFYASTSTGNGTGKVAHFDHRGLVLQANKGISFSPHDNTDTNPYGSDSNILDDYERGAFQPAITSVNNPQPTQTAYVHQYGYYVKIGRMVHLRVDIEFSTSGVSGGTGEAVLSNLPFTSSSEQNAYGITMAVGYSPNWSNNRCPTGGYMNPNTTFIYLMPYNTNGTTFSMGADIGGGTRLIAGCTYMTDS